MVLAESCDLHMALAVLFLAESRATALVTRHRSVGKERCIYMRRLAGTPEIDLVEAVALIVILSMQQTLFHVFHTLDHQDSGPLGPR